MEDKKVYVVEVDYDCELKPGEYAKVHCVLGVYEDKLDALKFVAVNSDADFTEKDMLDGLEAEGTVEVWWHPFMVRDNFAKRAYCTVTEHVLTAKGGS